MKIKEVIVVEGKSDTIAVHRAVEADTIETNGSAINQETLELIEYAHALRGVIVFTDPDYPGRRIRSIIEERIPTVQHAFLTKEESMPKHKGSLGIEHASPEAIQQALQAVYSIPVGEEASIEKGLLIRLGLIGMPESKQIRHEIGKRLKIGQTNGKTLLKRLNMFQITEEQLIKTLQQIKDEEKND